MAGLNKVILIGHLGADPETKTTQSGGMLARLRLATSESWRDKQTGERRDKTEWHNVVIFSEGLAKIAQQYLRKGSKIYAEGQLQTRKWQDQSGADRYSTEIVLNGFAAKLIMLDGGGSNHGGESFDAPLSSGSAAAKPAASGGGFDDEIPF